MCAAWGWARWAGYKMDLDGWVDGCCLNEMMMIRNATLCYSMIPVHDS